MADISPVTRGRRKPTGGGRETTVWYLVRISGVALFVLALSHYIIQHFIFDPSQQTAEWIATHRWNQLIWRASDWALLMVVLLHSALGIRTVVRDYVHGPRARIDHVVGALPADRAAVRAGHHRGRHAPAPRGHLSG